MGQNLSLTPGSCPTGTEPACVITDKKCKINEGFGMQSNSGLLLLFILIVLVIITIIYYNKNKNK